MAGLITNKDDMYELLNRGAFGNRFHSWNSWEELVQSGYYGFVSVRSKGWSDPVRIYDKSFESVEMLADSGQFDHGEYVFYESTPHDTRVIQGELTRLPYPGPYGLFFKYTFVKLPMRVAFEDHPQEIGYARGLVADFILREYVDPPSLEDILEIIDGFAPHDTYTGTVVEFTTFSVPVGVLQRQTVIWEVRNY